MGNVSDGIEQMAWSPDQDLVVMITGAGNLLLMTREFDPLTEVPMFPEEFGEGIYHASILSSICPFSKAYYCGLGQKGDPVPWFTGKTHSSTTNSTSMMTLEPNTR